MLRDIRIAKGMDPKDMQVLITLFTLLLEDHRINLKVIYLT